MIVLNKIKNLNTSEIWSEIKHFFKKLKFNHFNMLSVNQKI